VFMMMWAPNGILGRQGVGEKVIGLARFLPVRRKAPQEKGRGVS